MLSWLGNLKNIVMFILGFRDGDFDSNDSLNVFKMGKVAPISLLCLFVSSMRSL